MILSLPETNSGHARVKLDIQRIDYAAPEAGGAIGGVQAGLPRWLARIELDRVDADDADAWYSFLDRMRGRLRRFYAVDSTRLRPLAHQFGMLGLTRASGGAFNGSAASWSQAINADGDATLNLTGLPAGFTLSARDLIGFKWDASGAAADTFERRTLARCVAGGVANASGALSVLIEPPLDTLLVPAAAIAHFDSPACVMQLVPEETDLAPIGVGGTISGGTILGVQDLRP